MSENLASPTVFPSEADRRYWLLSKALEVVSLDRAIELARAAEEFITETSSRARAEPTRTISLSPARGPQDRLAGEGDAVVDSAAPRVAQNMAVGQSHASTNSTAPQAPQSTRAEQGDAAVNSRAVDSAPGVVAKPGSRSALPLSRDQREEVLSRMAEGVKNAVLALEFGLTPRQVQGIRMGSGREIARRREQLETVQVEAALARSEPKPSGDVYIEEIVRYLRQQNDVVVPQEEGIFLVNARFRMPAPELVARANRMRTRQGKPEFKLAAPAPRVREKTGSTNGHPVFWPNQLSETKTATQTSEAWVSGS